MNLFDKNDDLTFTEDNLDFTYFLNGSYDTFTYACKFNFNTIYSNYARLFSWGKVGQGSGNIYASLTASGGSHAGQIIFGNQQIDVKTNPGTPSPQADTDYWFMFHYTNSGGNPPCYIKVCRDRAGTDVFYELSSTIQFTTVVGGRDSFYLNASQANTAESMDGSITEITVSNQFLTWGECFNYTASRSILSADVFKENSKLLKETYLSKAEMSEFYNNIPSDSTTGIYRFSGGAFTQNNHMELTTNSGDIPMPSPTAVVHGATLDIPLDTPLDMSGFFQGGSWEFSFACKFNVSQTHNNYGRLFGWGVSGVLDDSIRIALATNTSHN